MNRTLKKQYPDLCAYLQKGVYLDIDDKGIYVQDKDGYLWSDCGRYDSLDTAFAALCVHLAKYYKTMEEKPRVTIDLIDFIRTHNVSCIPNKVERNEVELTLGLPTAYMAKNNNGAHNWYRTSPIWKYGELEVYFDDEDCIHYCSFKNLDCVTYHYPVRGIDFDLHYDFPDTPSILEFHEILENHGIDHKIQVPVDRDEGGYRLLCKNDVWVYFREEHLGSMETSVIDSVNHGMSLIEWEDI